MYVQIFSIFDYNKTPLALLETKDLVHEQSTERISYADQGKIGYVIGLRMEHYRHLWRIHTVNQLQEHTEKSIHR